MKRFKDKVIELVSIAAQNLWGHVNHEDVRACNEVFWRKRGRRRKGDRW